MPAPVAGIHVFLILAYRKQDVDGRAFASPKGFGPAGGSSPAMTRKSWSNMRFMHVNPLFPALTAAQVATM
jgi:hypothetical protein